MPIKPMPAIPMRSMRVGEWGVIEVTRSQALLGNALGQALLGGAAPRSRASINSRSQAELGTEKNYAALLLFCFLNTNQLQGVDQLAALSRDANYRQSFQRARDWLRSLCVAVPFAVLGTPLSIGNARHPNGVIDQPEAINKLTEPRLN